MPKISKPTYSLFLALHEMGSGKVRLRITEKQRKIKKNIKTNYRIAVKWWSKSQDRFCSHDQNWPL